MLTETRLTKSTESYLAAFSRSLLSSLLLATSGPFASAHIITPRSLIVETSARVSTPSIPGTPWSAIQLDRVCTEAQWLGFWQCSWTTSPVTLMPLDSKYLGSPKTSFSSPLGTP